MDFEAVYNQYYASIYSYILKKIKNVQDAEDLTSEVFFACLKNFDRYDSEKSSIVSWLFVITKNKLKNYYRGRKDIVSIDDDDNPIDFPSDDDFENSIYLSEMRTLINKAMAELSPREQKIIILKYYNGLKSEQIAEKVGLSAVNVRVILNRSLIKLREYCEKNNIKWEF